MKLQKLSLTNFRGFEDLNIAFDGKSAVLFGINGAGKSSILNSISFIFSRIINRVVTSRIKVQSTLRPEDIYFGAAETTVSAFFQLAGVDTPLPFAIRYVKSTKQYLSNKRTSQMLSDVFRFVYLTQDFMEQTTSRVVSSNIDTTLTPPPENEPHLPRTILDANPTTHDEPLPILVNYGVNRTVFDIPLRTHKHDFERFETYKGAVDSKIDFRAFFEWFRNQEDYEKQRQGELHDFGYRDSALEAVRKAVTAMMPEISNIRVDRRPLHMRADKIVWYENPFAMGNGAVSARESKVFPLCIEQLSDGEKCTLAMIGDLIRRLALANPDSSDPRQGPGIVLIDEIELHMHPEWQRRIIRVLHEQFPNIQFIITTHSPQVIGELPQDNSFMLFKLETDEQSGVPQLQQVVNAYYDSNLVLDDFMGASSINRQVKEMESSMFRFIEKKQYDDAQQLCKEIARLTNGTNPAVTRASILIRRGAQKSQQ